MWQKNVTYFGWETTWELFQRFHLLFICWSSAFVVSKKANYNYIHALLVERREDPMSLSRENRTLPGLSIYAAMNQPFLF